MHKSWRDCQEWEREGLKLSTTSNTACKLYDAALTQYVGWYEEPLFGGLESTFRQLIEADPTFVMGKVICNGLELMGTGRTTRTDLEFRQNIDDLVKLAANTSSNLTPREKLHVNAIQLWANGNLGGAVSVWEDIILDNPCDLLAIKFAHDGCFYLGKATEMRDQIARVLPQWLNTTPLYSYLHGMFAFGLEETNRYPEAVKHAKLGLELNRKDAWSTHALAHVYEMTAGQDKGIKLMLDTETDWKECSALACHNYWHLALYYVDKGQYEAALTIFDQQIEQRSKSGALLDLVDAISMLYRLELEGVNVGNRWQHLHELCKPHVNDHILCFNDAHYTMAYQRSGHKDYAEQLLSSLDEFIKSYPDYHMANVAKSVGYTVCEAFVAYDSGDYEKVVNLLQPVRYQIINIGGSHAQVTEHKFRRFFVAVVNAKMVVL
ncbi:Tetratricopeptide repeat protein 38, variant 3 [Chamberlinius hualienensis]